MALPSYLPSTQFIVILSSIALSGSLVVAAQHYTNQPSSSSLNPISQTNAVSTGDWLAALHAIEGDNIKSVSDTDPSSTTEMLFAAAQSSNITDTVARTLLINLSQAKSQGLGSDIPTQEKLIEEAVARIQRERGTPSYTMDDLTVEVNNSKTAMKAYGNAVINVFTAHPDANFSNTIFALGITLENGNPSKLADLEKVQKEYRALAKDLLGIPTPSSLSPLHLKAVNNISLMAETYDDMKLLFKDSLRGLAGFQLYQGLNNETARMFTSIAQQFAENGILFNKDEPGLTWGLFLSSSQQ